MDDDFVWTTIKHKHEIVTSMITNAEGIFEYRNILWMDINIILQISIHILVTFHDRCGKIICFL